MAVTEYVPGMKPGSIVRNILVGCIYLFFFYLIPVVLAYAVFTNRNGIADKLSGVPGISDDGGVVSSIVIFLISLVVLSVIVGALPAEETPSTDEAPTETDGTNAEGDGEESDGGDSEESGDGGQSEESTASEPSADEQQQQVEETNKSDTEGEEVETAESELEERDLSDDELISAFETLVESEGMSVETAEMQGDTFVVEYRSFAQTEQEIAGEMGYVAGAYAGMVNEGHTSDRMEAAILNTNGERAGTFYVEYDWAEAYANDEISDEEFGQRVLSTLDAEEQARIEGDGNVAIA